VTGNTIYESDIFILDIDGNYLRQIFTDIPGRTGGLQFSIDGNLSGIEFRGKEAGTNDLDPRFSPDGSKIIFVNTNNDGISVRNIMVMDIDGRNRTILFEDAEMPDWQ